jgi:hypothetical protein
MPGNERIISSSLPYSRTYRKSRKPKRTKKAKTKIGKLQKQITKIKQQIPIPELKAVDINSFSTAVSDTAGANHPMIQIAQGNTAGQRNGDTVVLKHSTLNLVVKKGDGTNMLRLILAATPSTSNLVLSDVLQYANLTSNGILPFASPYKFQPTTAEKTYTVLFDKVYNLTDEVEKIVDKIKISYGKNGRRIHFNNVTSIMPENYNISLMYISDSSASVHPSIAYTFRTRYTDA